MMQRVRYSVVLAIYPNTRGYGFALFEGPLSPVDWGVVEARGRDKNQRCLRRIDLMLAHHQPEALVLQDMTETGTRRARRIRNLNSAIQTAAYTRSIPVFRYSRADVYRNFAHLVPPTKHAIAEIIAKHIPAFERYPLPPRKIWESEDARMGIFDAAALALTFFYSNSGLEGGPAKPTVTPLWPII